MKLPVRIRHPLRWSAALTLVGLALMVWSLVQPTPMPIMLAMTVGQMFGVTAFAIYIYVVIRDVRRSRVPGTAVEAADPADREIP